MKGINFRAIFAVVIGLCLSYSLIAQTRTSASSVADKYIISAKAGGVNFVEGTVTVIRATGRSGVLLKSDQVEIGDRVTTGTDGRAEVLLNPGSFIRLGKNSSFEFGSTDLEDLQIRLDSGSAIFEVFAADEFRVSVSTPKGKVALVATGVYRIDISADGSGTIAVTKGKAEIGESTPTKIKDGRTGTIGTDTVAIAKFDKGKRDDLGEWSRTRAKELTAITSSLQNQHLRNSLLNGFTSGQWGIRDSFGLWIYSPMYGRYCFLPFGSGWYSPYGYGYWTGIYWNNLPPVVTYNGNSTNGGSTQSNTKTTTRITRGNQDPPNPDIKSTTRITRDTYEAPPFTKVGRGGSSDSGMPMRDLDNSSGDRSSSRVTSSSSSMPSYSPPPAPVSPAGDVKNTTRRID